MGRAGPPEAPGERGPRRLLEAARACGRPSGPRDEGSPPSGTCLPHCLLPAGGAGARCRTQHPDSCMAGDGRTCGSRRDCRAHGSLSRLASGNCGCADGTTHVFGGGRGLRCRNRSGSRQAPADGPCRWEVASVCPKYPFLRAFSLGSWELQVLESSLETAPSPLCPNPLFSVNKATQSQMSAFCFISDN